MCLTLKASRHNGNTVALPKKKPATQQQKPSNPTDWQWSSAMGAVHFWILPYDFSQSRLADRNRTSNACTFIALMVAKYLYHSSCCLPPAATLHRDESLFMMRDVLSILANSIVEGNDWHSEGMRNRFRRRLLTDEKNNASLFTIPQAIAEVSGIHEVDFKVVKDPYKNLAMYIRAAIESNLMLYFSQIFILVIMVERAILLVYDRDAEAIVLFDGHAHNKNGAMIVAAPYDQLEAFCYFVIMRLFPDLTENKTFEISVVQIINDTPPKGVVADAKPRPAPRNVVQGKVFPDPAANPDVGEETETNQTVGICGHSICFACLPKLSPDKNCPHCQHEASFLLGPKNFLIEELVQYRAKPKTAEDDANFARILAENVREAEEELEKLEEEWHRLEGIRAQRVAQLTQEDPQQRLIRELERRRQGELAAQAQLRWRQEMEQERDRERLQQGHRRLEETLRQFGEVPQERRYAGNFGGQRIEWGTFNSNGYPRGFVSPQAVLPPAQTLPYPRPAYQPQAYNPPSVARSMRYAWTGEAAPHL